MGADLSTLDKHDVAAALTALGEAYAPYCEACLKNGIGGAEALDLDDEDLAELGVNSRLRRKALLKKLRRAKFASTMKHEGALAFWRECFVSKSDFFMTKKGTDEHTRLWATRRRRRDE